MIGAQPCCLTKPAQYSGSVWVWYLADRYTNLEIRYLLEQIKPYEGIAILTRNLRHNLDKTFSSLPEM
jgi:hypothetical protein